MTDLIHLTQGGFVSLTSDGFQLYDQYAQPTVAHHEWLTRIPGVNFTPDIHAVSVTAATNGGFLLTTRSGPLDYTSGALYTADGYRDDGLFVAAPVEHVVVGSGVVVGTDGADVLVGGAGADVLYGGPGSDVLTGGQGGDKFLIGTDGSVDRITDFNAKEGDLLLVLDRDGYIQPGSAGLLLWDQRSGLLSWDVDSDAGQLAPVAVAVLEGSTAHLARANFAAGFQPSAIRTIASDGSYTEDVFDWGTKPWEHTTASFTPSGALEVYAVQNDDGSSTSRWWDVANTQPWSMRYAEFDATGHVTSYTVWDDHGSVI